MTFFFKYTALFACFTVLGYSMLGEIKAQDPETIKLSLQEAITYGLQHNTELQNARVDVNIAERQIWEITASGLPQVNGSLGYQYFFEIPTNLVPAEFFGGEPGEFAEIQFGTEQNLTASLSVSQLVFDGAYIIGLQTSRIYRDLAGQNRLRTEIEVKRILTQNYYLALSVSENLNILRGNLSNMENSLRESQGLLEAGFTDPINVDQLRLTVSNMKNTISNMERQKKVTFNMLKFQMGMDISQKIELSDQLEDLFTQISLENLTVNSFDPHSHIDFQVMESQERMLTASMRRELSFYLPSLSASYSYQLMAARNEFNFFDDESWFPTSVLGVNINIPIFSSGLRHSKVQQARLEVEKARNSKEQVAQSLIMQKQQAQADMRNAMENYQNEKENVALAEKILSRTQIMFKEGMASSLELTQASDQLLATQSNYINAMFEVLDAKTSLDRALGRL